ncbi:MAG: geranylgeranylglyceryl/heptaprenylglyceryl phosphate synthase [Candidatus Micrarchaeia archaeon]
MKAGKVEKYILEKIEREGALIGVVIDPLDHPSPEAAVAAAGGACAAGADLVTVGGSTGAQGELLDTVVRGIKEKVDCPVVLFPGNIATLSRHADAVYFMSLLNSRNPYWISQAQTLAAPVVKALGIEPLPMGYIVVEPGGTVGWVGDANLVPRDKPKIAAALALAGEFMGCRMIFTDCGSASPAGSVPLDMVRAVRQAISVPYLVAGGIRTPKEAADIISAGADWVQIGTALERAGEKGKAFKEFLRAVKEAGRRRVLPFKEKSA